MKKFGFSRKDKDGGDRSKDASPANANPYAVNAAPDPYANANPSPPPPRYQPAPGGAPNDRYREEKTPAYTSNQAGGYGSAGGYGGNRFGGGSEAGGAPASRYGNGGYGGFGGAPAANRYDSGPQASEPVAPSGNRFGQPPSANRFGGGAPAATPAPTPSAYGGGSRYGGGAAADPAPGGYGGGSRYGGAPAASTAGNRYGGPSAGYGAEQDAAAPASTWESGRGDGPPTDYGAYADRQLTAEEQEEEDVLGTKNEIRAIKQQDVSSTRNALRIAQMAEEQGRATLERLQQQGERIHNTERNLDLASNQNRLAAEKAREIKTLNRSMFAVHVSNPFTSGKRTQEREAEVLRLAQEDRERRDQTRAAAWSSDSRKQQLGMEINKAGQTGGPKKGSLADRAKYQFEADSEDEEMENEIDGNLDLLHGAAGRMKMYAGAMGQEIESQNKHIDRIGGKVDRVDDEIALNRSRLDRIK